MVLSINGEPVKYYDEFESVVKANAGNKVTLEVASEKQGVESAVSSPRALTVNVDEDGKLGFYAQWGRSHCPHRV